MIVSFKGSWDHEGPYWNVPTYFNFCKLAVEDESVFENFRKDLTYKNKQSFVYSSVVGCDSRGPNTAKMFLNYVKEEYPHLINHFDSFLENEKYGNPRLHTTFTDKFKTWAFSNNTSRHIKVLGDLIKEFESLDDFDIGEIGPGYGTQAKLISSLYKWKSYSFIDYLYPIKLVEKYMSKFEDIDNMFFYDTENIEVKNYDLVISDSSLSEFDDEGVDFYMKYVLSNSKNCYCTMNDSYRKTKTVEKFGNIFDEVKVIPDRPALNPDNACYIIIGKNKDD